MMVVLAFLGAWLPVVPPDYASGPCRARGTTDVGIKRLVYPIYSSGCFCPLDKTGMTGIGVRMSPEKWHKAENFVACHRGRIAKTICQLDVHTSVSTSTITDLISC